MRWRPTRSRSPVAAPYRGAGQFYENQVLPCARCHKVGGEGGEAGPDLSLIGAQKKKEYLLEVHHQAERAHRRRIRRGDDHAQERRHRDRLRGERDSPPQIVLKRADNTTTSIDPKQVKERVTAPSSMPEIYGQVLTRAQLRDLVVVPRRADARPAG